MPKHTGWTATPRRTRGFAAFHSAAAVRAAPIGRTRSSASQLAAARTCSARIP